MDVGVIGTGNMGRNHLRVYSELRWVDHLYIYDTNPSQIEILKNKFEDVEVCGSLGELLKKVDAASICVPTPAHFSTSKENVSNGELLIKLRDRENLTVGVGHIERFNPIISEIKKLSEKPRYVEVKRHNPSSTRIKDSSVIGDLMIHDIDIVWNILFKGRKENAIYAFGDSNFCKVIVKFNKQIVALSASRIAAKKIRTIYLEEELKSIEGNFMDQEVFIYRKPTKYSSENDKYTQENLIEKVLINKVEPLKRELKEFLYAVKMGKPFPVTLEEALLNVRKVEVIKNKL